jgi:hypothetical protein
MQKKMLVFWSMGELIILLSRFTDLYIIPRERVSHFHKPYYGTGEKN